ncbi:MAG: glycoside hydrolase family 53 protein [Chitinophagaceae bacterium]
MRKTRLFVLLILSFFSGVACTRSSAPILPSSPIGNTPVVPASGLTYRGMDLSYAFKIEGERGIQFMDTDGTQLPLFQICKNHGVNIVRLRLWVNPSDSDRECSLSAVESQARALSALGIKLWLDIHYSDTWADPGHQTLPARWAGSSFADLVDSVYQYTSQVMQQLLSQGTPPEIVQIGNEINGGILWPDGQTNAYTDNNWNHLATLLDTAYGAVTTSSPTTKVMIHIAGITDANRFFDQCDQFGVRYDLMGISFYPWWHGKDFTALQDSLNMLTLQHGNKGVLIAETAYPFTLSGADQATNIVGSSSQLMNPYPATPAGQLDFLVDLMSVVKKVSNGKGLGVCYWEPDWVAYNGPTATDWQNGSSYENLAMFNFNFKAQISFDAFRAN